MKNWKKIIVLSALMFCALGCTGKIEYQGHWPGKLNAIETYETSPPSKIIYKGYQPPYPMDPPQGYEYK